MLYIINGKKATNHIQCYILYYFRAMANYFYVKIKYLHFLLVYIIYIIYICTVARL